MEDVTYSMGFERKKKTILNLISGLAGFAITTLLGILIPRLFILSYGSEINGLISSVKQIFAYLILLEAGVGTATRQALYGAFANQDNNKVSSIIAATNRFYKKTGKIYAFAVLALAIGYPIIVKTDIPPVIVICIILFQGEAGVLKYFVGAKLQLLLTADGKSYIINNISTTFSILSNIARVALLVFGASVLWVQAVFCLVDICQVTILVIYVKKKYPWLDADANPDFGALSQKNAVIWQQVSGLVFNNTDIILLTLFCDLKIVSVYSMYTMLYGMVANIIGYISSSFSFALGQIFHEDRDRFCRIQAVFETYYLSLCFSLYTVAYIFIIPFLRLYTGGVTDINYIDKFLPVIFLFCQLLDYGRATSSGVINFGQHFEQTKWRCVIEALINIIVSIVLVNILGLYGVLCGTLAALIYRTNDMIWYANHIVLERSVLPTYFRWGRNALMSIVCLCLFHNNSLQFDSYYELIKMALIIAPVICVVFFLCNTFIDKEARRMILNRLKGYLTPETGNKRRNRK